MEIGKFKEIYKDKNGKIVDVCFSVHIGRWHYSFNTEKQRNRFYNWLITNVVICDIDFTKRNKVDEKYLLMLRAE